MRNERRSWRALAVAAPLAAALACGGESQESPSETAGETAGEKNWTVEATPSPGKAGAVAENPNVPAPSTEIPADFPEDMPRYPNVEVLAARTAMGKGISLSMETADDVDKVAGFYADNFRAQDWKTDVRRTPDGHAIFAEKGDRKASAVVRPRDDGAGAKVDVIVMVN